jgi:hypothetical protein
LRQTYKEVPMTTFPQQIAVVGCFNVPRKLNPLHPRADGEAVAAGSKKGIPFSSVSPAPLTSCLPSSASPKPSSPQAAKTFLSSRHLMQEKEPMLRRFMT